MKCCPTCQRAYADETLSFCRADGALATVLCAELAATAGEVLASSTVKDLVSGSGIAFVESDDLISAAHGEWRLFSVT